MSHEDQLSDENSIRVIVDGTNLEYQIGVHPGMRLMDVVAHPAMRHKLTYYAVNDLCGRSLNLECDAQVILGHTVILSPRDNRGEAGTHRRESSRKRLLSDQLVEERLFLHNLSTLLHTYCPLLQEYVFEVDEFETFRCWLSNIFYFTQQSYEKLELALSVWGEVDRTQIGECLDHNLWYTLYSYITNFYSFQRKINKVLRCNNCFAGLCRKARGASRHNLQSLIYVPVQKLTDYNDWVANLSMETPLESPDYDLLAAHSVALNRLVAQQTKSAEILQNQVSKQRIYSTLKSNPAELDSKLNIHKRMRHLMGRKSASETRRRRKSLNDLIDTPLAPFDDPPDPESQLDGNYIVDYLVKLVKKNEIINGVIFLFEKRVMIAERRGNMEYVAEKCYVCLSDMWMSPPGFNGADPGADETLLLGWPLHTQKVIFDSWDLRESFREQLEHLTERYYRKGWSPYRFEMPLSLVDELSHDSSPRDQSTVHVNRLTRPTDLLTSCDPSCDPSLVSFWLQSSALKHRKESTTSSRRDFELLKGFELLLPILEFCAQMSKSKSGSKSPPALYITTKGTQPSPLQESEPRKKSSLAGVFRVRKISGSVAPPNLAASTSLHSFGSARGLESTDGGSSSGSIPGLFSRPITETCSEDGLPPQPIRDLLYAIYHRCGDLQGIFRQPCSSAVKSRLKEQLNRGENVDFWDMNPHLLCDTLKDYLNSLPEPILGKTKHFLKNGDFAKMKLALAEMPSPNYQLLLRVVFVFSHCLEGQLKLTPDKRLTLEGLVTCVAPSIFNDEGSNPDLLRKSQGKQTTIPDILADMLTNARELFGDNWNLVRIEFDRAIESGIADRRSTASSSDINYLPEPPTNESSTRHQTTSNQRPPLLPTPPARAHVSSPSAHSFDSGIAISTMEHDLSPAEDQTTPPPPPVRKTPIRSSIPPPAVYLEEASGRTSYRVTPPPHYPNSPQRPTRVSEPAVSLTQTVRSHGDPVYTPVTRRIRSRPLQPRPVSEVVTSPGRDAFVCPIYTSDDDCTDFV